ncbi:MAG: hypothetical protein K2M79_06575 [Muribaculaceae bacterium]|nr:hypothetical protein [Muribaculaceae bacterium]
MKKFYTYLMSVMCLLVGLSAQAKTVTVTINDPAGATVINTSTTYAPITFTNGKAEGVVLGNDGGLQVSLERGYELKDIKVNANTVYGNYVSSSEIPDGALVAINVEKLQAKHVTFTIDNPAAASLYNTVTYTHYSFDTSGTLSLDLEPSAWINVNTNQGYDIDRILIDGVAFTGGFSIPISAMNNNGTVAIFTKEKEASVFYVEADPSLVSLTLDYSTVYNASNFGDGKWTVETANPYSSLSVNAVDGYVIASLEAVKEDGASEDVLNEYQRYQQSASLYLGSYASGTTFKINAAKLSDLRSAHVSLEVVDGTADQISVIRENAEVPASDFASIAIIPGSELYISAAAYGKSLYKVTVNGQPVTPQGSTYYLYNLQDNDVIKVWPNFPTVEVPVHISFTNPGTSGVLTLSVDGINVSSEKWLADDFAVNLGSRLGFTLNSSEYTVESVELNGQTMSNYGFEYTVSDESEVKVVINATKLANFQVTVYFEPGTVNIYRGWGESDPVTIPDGADEVSFEVTPANNQLNFKAADGYVITSIIDGNDNSYSNSVYVSGDMVLTVYTDKIERDKVCAVYLDPESPRWQYSQVTLSYSTDARKEIALSNGYNIFEFGSFDCPFQLGLYPEADVYVNGDPAENMYGVYPALSDLPTNSVIKIYGKGKDVPTYQLTLENNSNGGMTILADYVNALESNSARVLGTTDIEFVAGPATVADEATSKYVVKVNGTQVMPNSEGRLIATITGDSAITVEDDESSSIFEVTADDSEAVIYNLQGIRVNNPQNGIFIVNGKKVKF